MIDVSSLAHATPTEIRGLIRSGEWDRPTTGLALGYVQANLVIVPESLAADFREYCTLNGQAMPILDVTGPGDPRPLRAAPDADLRTDLPRYRVYRHGTLSDELADIRDVWHDDSVAFLLGCSFSAEARLLESGIRLRHMEMGKNVPMFRTNRQCRPAGIFHGPLVVSMRPILNEQVDAAARITADYPLAHGAPVQVGRPEEIGIDVTRPDWGDVVIPAENETPVFWACGVTPQAAIIESAPEIAITHAPGHMFITDLPDRSVRGKLPPVA